MTYVHTYCTHVHTRTGCAEPIWTGQNGAMSAFCGKVHANNYDAGFKDDDDAEQGTAVQAPTVVYDVRLFNSSSFLRSLKHACLHPSCVVHRASCVAASFFVERPPLRASLIGTNLFPARFRFLLYLVATPHTIEIPTWPSDAPVSFARTCLFLHRQNQCRYRYFLVCHRLPTFTPLICTCSLRFFFIT